MSSEGKPVFVDMGVLDLRKEADAYSKLRQIYDTVTEVCRTYHGTEMALESPFYGKNAQVILKLGRAQGAAMLAALEYGITMFMNMLPGRPSRRSPATAPPPRSRSA